MSRKPIYDENLVNQTIGLPKGLYAKVQHEAARESVEQGRRITASDLVRRALEALVGSNDAPKAVAAVPVLPGWPS